MARKSEYMGFEEAVAWVMRTQRVSRDRAIKLLMQKVSSGALPATGINPLTGRRENIPPEAWPKVPTDS